MASLSYIQLISTLIALAVGIGIAWGAMRTTVVKLSDRTDKLDEIVQSIRPFIVQMDTLCSKVDKLSDHVADMRVEIGQHSAILKKE